jgi:hypothetical protein
MRRNKMKAHISIFGVQPLTYSENVIESLLVKFKSFNQVTDQDDPDWFLEIKGLYQNDHHYSVAICKASAVKIDGIDFIFNAHLLCNSRINIFTIVFDLKSEGCVETMLTTENIRNMIVLSLDDKRIDCIKSATEKAINIVSSMMKVNQEKVIIKKNTCNITIFITPDGDVSLPIKKDLIYNFILSDNTERMSVRREIIKISDKTIIFFGGRVHLVASTSYNDINVLKNIMLNLQIMWFFVPIYLNISSKLHFQMVSGNADYSTDELEEKAMILSYISKTIMLQNESERISYESLSKILYDRIEYLWRIEGSIRQFDKYSSFFELFVKNTRDIRSRKADEILNYVLTVLAIFGAVGFWADILHAEIIIREWGTFERFINYATRSAFGFTTIVIVLMSALIAVTLIYYNVTKKHGKSKTKKKKSIFES